MSTFAKLPKTFSAMAFVGLSVYGLSAAILGGTLFYLRSKLRSINAGKNAQGQEVATVEKVIIYPIKSLRGIIIETAEVTKLGLKYGRFRDRQWIIVKTDGTFLTQRQQPSLANITLQFEDGCILLEAADMPSISLKPITKIDNSTQKQRCNVYGQDIDCVDCGDEAAEWLQKFLNRSDVRFAQFLPNHFDPRIHLRNLNQHKDPGNIIYQDDSAFLMLSMASVEDLNGRITNLEDKISYRNFRPNFLLNNCQRYEEDNWNFVSIGSAKFAFMEPCTRCILTKVNPETGIMNKHEPLKTLKSYRLAEGTKSQRRFGKEQNSQVAMKSPCFGSYYGTDTIGVISVGDSVYLN